ncbi:MAG: sugar phosphate nucleotidyltransferase, partial [Rhodothermales bacterium]
MKLIIPMAGRGTRVRPHSHVTPKPLLAVKGKSMVERIVDTFNRVLPQHLDEGVFVLGPDFGDEVRRQLTDICERHGLQAHFPIQEVALGTAHAVAAARDHLQGEGIVVFADTVFEMDPGVDLEGADVVAWVKHVDDPSRFGVAVREGDRIVALVEKPQELISTEALIGIYYVRDLAWLHRGITYLFENDLRGHGEFQLTDAFDVLLKEGALFKTATVNEWLDCGTIESLMDTTMYLLAHEPGAERQGEVHNSVIHEPVFIGPGAKVTDSVVGPNVSIEAGVRLSGSVVRDSILFAHACVENAVLVHSLVGAHAEVRGRARRVNVGDHSVLD